MRVVVVGATGNVGTSLVTALLTEPSVEEVVGIARRRPSLRLPRLRWHPAEVASDDLVTPFRGADAVVHLAWAIQPSHDERAMARTNLLGSGRVFDAVARAGVPALVYASSVGAYAPGPKEPRVDESWPVGGIASSFYSRHKATVERMLDRLERAHPAVRVVRMRPGLIFKEGQASEARRFFLGPFVPGILLRPDVLPVLPDVRGLRFQAVHTDDVADAYRRAVVGDARGAFNLVAEPVLDLPTIAASVGARTIRVPASVVRAAVRATWRAHLQPTPVGWFEMGLREPLLAADRAHRVLGWRPSRSALDAVCELLTGIGHGRGERTPPLDPTTGGPLRLGELASGVGAEDGAGSAPAA
jgi:nucleoside-diphosphate-sugar epimerase